MSLSIADVAGAWNVTYARIAAGDKNIELTPPEVAGTILLSPGGEMSAIVRGPVEFFGVEWTAYSGTVRIEDDRLINEVRLGTGLVTTGSTVERNIQLLDTGLLLLTGQLMEHTFMIGWTRLSEINI